MPHSFLAVFLAFGCLSAASPSFAADRVVCFLPHAVHSAAEDSGDVPGSSPQAIESTPDRWLTTTEDSTTASAWHRYQTLWRAHYRSPENGVIRRYFGFATGGRAGSPNHRLAISRGRSAPSGLNWKRGSFTKIQTPHFVIYSRSDQTTSTRVAEELEQAYWVWTQMCFPFWEAATQVESHLAEMPATDSNETIASYLEELGKRVTTKKRMKVILFRDAAEYAQTLGAAVPGIEKSTGFYNDQQKVTYLFAPRLPDDETVSQAESGQVRDGMFATLRHEVVHQLFREATGKSSPAGGPGADRDFWLVEGIAGYFESMVSGDGWVTLGGWDSPRLQFARYRILAGGDQMPMEELRRDGRESAQMRPDLSRWYAHAIANTHRLLDGGDPSGRTWVYARLAAVYELPEFSKAANDETPPVVNSADDMRTFLTLDDIDLRSNPASRTLTQLCLAGCDVTANGIEQLGPQDKLNWLDLARLKVDSRAVAELSPDPKTVRQLSFEATRVTDQVAPWLARASNLAELDLSWTLVGDEAVKAIANHAKLETLWLTGSKVTDASMETIAGLRRLSSVDLQRTQVSEAGLSRLRELRPKLTINPLELRESR